MWFNVPRRSAPDLYSERYASGRPKYSTCPEGGAMFEIPDVDQRHDPNNVSGYVPAPTYEFDWGD